MTTSSSAWGDDEGETPSSGRGPTPAVIRTVLRQVAPGGTARGRRLARAAARSAEVTGDLRAVPRLLAEARRADPHADTRLPWVTAAAAKQLHGDGDIDTAHRVLVEALESRTLDGPPDGPLDEDVVDALHLLLVVCAFGGRDELWAPVLRILERLRPLLPDTLQLTDVPALDPLLAAVHGLPDERDPRRIVRVATAASDLDRGTECGDALRRVVRDGRSGGAVASAVNTLRILALGAYEEGRWGRGRGPRHRSARGLRRPRSPAAGRAGAMVSRPRRRGARGGRRRPHPDRRADRVGRPPGRPDARRLRGTGPDLGRPRPGRLRRRLARGHRRRPARSPGAPGPGAVGDPRPGRGGDPHPPAIRGAHPRRCRACGPLAGAFPPLRAARRGRDRDGGVRRPRRRPLRGRVRPARRRAVAVRPRPPPTRPRRAAPACPIDDRGARAAPARARHLHRISVPARGSPGRAPNCARPVTPPTGGPVDPGGRGSRPSPPRSARSRVWRRPG